MGMVLEAWSLSFCSVPCARWWIIEGVLLIHSLLHARQMLGTRHDTLIVMGVDFGYRKFGLGFPLYHF